MRAGRTELVKLSQIGRFLGQDAAEVKLLVEVDGLAHTRVPGKTRPVIRVFLRDFHEFVMGRMRGESAMKVYDEFRRAFFASQEICGKTKTTDEDED